MSDSMSSVVYDPPTSGFVLAPDDSASTAPPPAPALGVSTPASPSAGLPGAGPEPITPISSAMINNPSLLGNSDGGLDWDKASKLGTSIANGATNLLTSGKFSTATDPDAPPANVGSVMANVPPVNAPAATDAPSTPIPPAALQGMGPGPVGPNGPSSASPAPSAPTAPSDAPATIDSVKNNVGNVRDNGVPWVGKVGSSGGYAGFDTPENGVSAAAQNVLSKARENGGQISLNQLAAVWAPKGDGKNDPVAYGKNLGTFVGVDPNTPLSLDQLKQPQLLQSVVQGIGRQENRNSTLDPSVYASGVATGLQRYGQPGAGSPGSPTSGAIPPAIPLPGNGNLPGGPNANSMPEDRGGNIPPQDPQMAAIGIPTLDPSMYRSTLSDRLLAMGAGLAGARTLGQGLGQGMTNLSNLKAQDRSNNLKYQTDVIAQARANAQMQNQNLVLGMKMQPKPTGKITMGTNGGPDLQEFIDPTSGQTSYRPMQGQTAQTSNAANRSAVVQGQISGTTKGNQTLAADTVKDSGDAIDNIVHAGVPAAEKLQTIANFQKVASDPQAAAGPQLAQQFKRYMATELGLGPADASSAQIADAWGKQVTSGGFANAKGVAVRNQKEFDFFKGQLASIDTDPKAIGALVAPAQQAAQHQLDVYKAWRGTPVEQQNALRTSPGAFDAWKAKQDAPYVDQIGSGPTVSKDQSGKWNVTKSGTKFQIVGTTPTQQQ